MTAKNFLHHLYQKVWEFIIEEKEFDNYWLNDEDRDYSPPEFYSDSIPRLIKSLKEEFPFFETYKKVVGAIDLQERQIIVDFMIWYREIENKTAHHIYNEFHFEGFNLSPLENLIEYIQSKTLPDVLELNKYREDKMDIIFKSLEKFTSASKSLKERRANKKIIEIEDEYDVQDILHVMLKPHFPTVRIEDVVSGNAVEKFLKIDFVVSDIKVAIECKCIRDKAHANGITKEINDDIQTYHKHQDCSYLIFFIYDRNLLISSPDALEDQYSKKQTFDGKEMIIHLIIRPKN